MSNNNKPDIFPGINQTISEIPNKTVHDQNGPIREERPEQLTHKKFIDMFFKRIKYKHGGWYYILKEEVVQLLYKELIKISKMVDDIFNSPYRIPLKIDPNILELCKSGKDSKEKSGKYLKKYFNNEKNGFKELYNRTNQLITKKNGINTNKNGINTNKLLHISNQTNRVISDYLSKKDTNSRLKKKLISEIRLRKFAIECGFTTWEQLKNMFRFLKYIYKHKLENNFDFGIDINTGNNNSNSNSNNNSNNNNSIFGSKDLLRGLNLYKGAQIQQYKERIRQALRHHDPEYSSNNEIFVNTNNEKHLYNIRRHPRVQAIQDYLESNNE